MLSNKQIEIINGALLGDAHAERRGEKTRIRFRQSIDNLEYMLYLLREMGDLSKGKLSMNWGKAPCYYFSTISKELFNKFRDDHYEGKNRIIPEDIEERITPLTIAIWIMDDGHKSRGNIVLNTHKYGKDDQERVLKAFSSRYGIEGAINKDRSNYRILISAKSTREILIPLVSGYILDCFKYKIRES